MIIGAKARELNQSELLSAEVRFGQLSVSDRVQFKSCTVLQGSPPGSSFAHSRPEPTPEAG
jgi:hypothetical protein